MSTSTKTRTMHLALRRIALGAAIAAIAAILVPVAVAKPADSIRLGPGEIPYLVSDQPIRLGPGEIPYVDYGTPAPTAGHRVAEGGDDIGFGVVGGAAMLVLLAVGGSLIAIRHSRKTRLSPA
jgi:hypothetical protein